MRSNGKIKIIVASDSIGETAELVARAGISQFNPKQCKNELLRYPYIESFEDVDEVIQVAKIQMLSLFIHLLNLK